MPDESGQPVPPPREPLPAESEETIRQKVERLARLWPKAVAVLVVLLAVTGLYKYVSGLQRTAELAAWDAFVRAEAETVNVPEKLPPRLDEALSAHPDTQAGFYARMKLAAAHFDEENLSEAREAAEAFLREHGDHFFAPQVRADYARLLEWEGNWKAAAEQHQRVLESGRAYLEPEAYLGLARCHEQQNRVDEARTLYIKVRDLAAERGWPPHVRNAANLRLIAILDVERLQAAGAAEDADGKAPPEEAAAAPDASGDGEAGEATATPGDDAPAPAAGDDGAAPTGDADGDEASPAGTKTADDDEETDAPAPDGAEE